MRRKRSMSPYSVIACWICMYVLLIIATSKAEQSPPAVPTAQTVNAPKSPIRPPTKYAKASNPDTSKPFITTTTTTATNDLLPTDVPTPLTFELFHSTDHEDFINQGGMMETGTNREYFRPIKVSTTWYELLNKRFNYIEDASLLYIHHLIDPFEPDLYSRFNDITDPFPVIVGLECSTENNHIYNSIEDIEGFFKYFYIIRLHFTNLRPYWKYYYPSFSANTAISELDFDDLSVNRDYPLFDFIMSLSSEMEALTLMENRFISILDPTVLFGDLVIDPGFADVDKEFVREHRHLCVHTHIAAAHDLQEVIQYIVDNIKKFAKGICSIDIPDHPPSKGDRRMRQENNAMDHNDIDYDHQFGNEDSDEQRQRQRRRQGEEDELEVLRFDDDGNLIDENGNILESKETQALQREKERKEAEERKRQREELEKNSNKKNQRGQKKDSTKPPKDHWTLRTLRRYISNYHSSPRYKNINQRLYDFIFYHYKEQYLFPFMKNHFCHEVQRELAMNETRIIDIRQGSYYQEGEDHDVHLIITERIERKHVPFEECLVGVKTSVFVHEDRLHEKFQECSVRVRQMFFTSNVSEKTMDDVLERFDGGGALSVRELACFEYFDEISEREETLCLPLNADVAEYNVLNVLSTSIVSPDLMIESMRYPQPNARPVGSTAISDPYLSMIDQTLPGTKDGIQPENTIPLIFAKTLVLGFGGGEFHHSLIKTFPFMSVESVEISADVVKTAFDHLGMKYLICDIEEYDYEKKKFESVYDDWVRDSYEGNSRSFMEKPFFASEHYTKVLHHKYYHFESFYDPEHPQYAELRGLPQQQQEQEIEDAVEEGIDKDTRDRNEKKEKKKRPTDEIYATYYEHLHDSASDARLHGQIVYDKKDFVCRSKIRIMDGWEFVRSSYMKIMEQESLLKEEWFEQHHSERSHDILSIFESVEYYDYIFFDAYDEKSTIWEGSTYLGESSASPSHFTQSVHMLKHLLRPYLGVLIAHIHKDESFKVQYEKIREIFGEQQVVVFDIANNDALIVAARDRFTSFMNDEYQYDCQVSFDRNGERVEKCVRIPIKSRKHLQSKGPQEEDEEEDDVFENLYAENPRYHFLVNPCAEEDKSTLPKEIALFARRLDFTPRMTLMYLLGLNCDPLASYDKTLAASQEELRLRKLRDEGKIPNEPPSPKASIENILHPAQDEYDDYHDEL